MLSCLEQAETSFNVSMRSKMLRFDRLHANGVSFNRGMDTASFQQWGGFQPRPWTKVPLLFSLLRCLSNFLPSSNPHNETTKRSWRPFPTNAFPNQPNRNSAKIIQNLIVCYPHTAVNPFHSQRILGRYTLEINLRLVWRSQNHTRRKGRVIETKSIGGDKSINLLLRDLPTLSTHLCQKDPHWRLE